MLTVNKELEHFRKEMDSWAAMYERLRKKNNMKDLGCQSKYVK